MKGSELDNLVADYEASGCERRDRSLGFLGMPDGYALMLNADRTHYFWLRDDGKESAVSWDKWRVRKGAFANAASLSKEREGV